MAETRKCIAKAQTFRFRSRSHMITHRVLIEIHDPEQLGSLTELLNLPTSCFSAKRHPYLNSRVHTHEVRGIGDPPGA